MSSLVNRYSGRRTPSLTHCDPPPQRCSTCGMLECLCRPRFFAGQVLTADDLNRLEHYVIGKNRLHNRQLHGWGVVNGLEVTCDACGKGVVVSCGYALSPCGDDIVVCDAVTVDVCALIKACCQAERSPCDPPTKRPPAGCDDEDGEWVLAIRYSESPAKSVKPLMPSQAPGCGCSTSAAATCTCGGSHSHGKSSGCGCGGGSSGARCGCKGTSAARPRTAPVQCEPTVTCEGFVFDVYRKPADDTEQDDPKRGLSLNPDSELYQRFACCIDLLWTRIPKMPGDMSAPNVLANLEAWRQWACTFKGYLQRYFSTKAGYNCELLARLNEIVCPSANSQNLAAQLPQIIVPLSYIWIDAVLACFCSALLPPCPEPMPNGCVPLATVRVSGESCRVLSICNWTTHRKFATTFPALQYWLGILPFGAVLRDLLDKICCFQITLPERKGEERHDELNHAAVGGVEAGRDPLRERAEARLNPKVGRPDRLQNAARMARSVVARGVAPFDPQTFVESALLSEKDKGPQHLSAAEIDNFPQFLALNQLLRPMALGAIPDTALGSIASVIGRISAVIRPETGSGKTAGGSAEVDALKREVETLRADLKRHGDQIDALKRGPKGRGNR